MRHLANLTVQRQRLLPVRVLETRGYADFGEHGRQHLAHLLEDFHGFLSFQITPFNIINPYRGKT